MRKVGLLLLLLLAACAPVATLQPARPADGTGGGLGFSLVTSADLEGIAALPYLELHWGDGLREFGVQTQLGASLYAKIRLDEGLAFKAAMGVPGPWYEGALLLDAGPVTLSGRLAYAGVEWRGRVDYLWLGGLSATYWYRSWGFEASVLFGEGGWVPAFSVGYRLEAPAPK